MEGRNEARKEKRKEKSKMNQYLKEGRQEKQRLLCAKRVKVFFVQLQKEQGRG